MKKNNDSEKTVYEKLFRIIGEDDPGKEAIVLNRKQIENVFSAIPGGLVMYKLKDDKTEMLYISPNVLEMLGVDPESYDKVVNKMSEIDKIFTPDREHMREVVQRSVEEETNLSFNMRIINRNKELVWLNVNGAALRQKDGSVICCGVVHNIDRYSKPYKDILDNVDEIAFIMDFNTKEILYANEKLRKTFLNNERLRAGQTVYEIFNEGDKACDLCDTDKFKNQPNISYEMRYKGRNYDVLSSHIIYYNRELAITCMSDATESKMLKTNFDATVEMMTCGRVKCIKDTAFTVVEANENFYNMIGYTPEQFKAEKNNSFAALIPKTQVAQIISSVDHNLVSTDYTKSEFCFRRRDGSVKYVIDQSAFVVEDGQEYIYSTFIDITERKLKETVVEERYQQELKHKSAVLKNLVAYCEINVTQDMIIDWSSRYGDESRVKVGMTIEECLDHLGHGEKLTKDTYNFLAKRIDRNVLLRSYNRGNKNLFYEYFFKYESGYNLWMSLEISLRANPSSKDIEAFIYFKDINNHKQISLAINQEVSEEYEVVACIDAVHGSIVRSIMDNASDKEMTVFYPDYADEIEKYVTTLLMPEDREFIQERTSILRIMSELESKNIYSFVFPETGIDGICRYKKFKYSYMDKDKKLILCTQRDVTDIVEDRVLASSMQENGEKLDNDVAAEQYLQKYKQIGEEILKHAHINSLTSLLNINGFCLECKKLFAENPDKNFFIIKRDLNNFKAFNELYGRKAGDEFLSYVGRHYKKIITDKGGCCGYLGGDDFIACYAGDKIESIETVTHQIQEIVDSYPIDYKFILSTGIYIVNDKNIPVITMCDRAEIALNQAKKTFTPFCIYDEGIRADIIKTQEIVRDFPEALKERQFHMYLQPQYNMLNGKIVGAEALVRWIHPDKGIISPGNFIPVLEQNALIAQLDNYIAEEACRVMSLLKKALPSVEPPTIAINLSRADLFRPKLIEELNAARAKYDIPTKDLRLEITESLYVEQPEVMINVVDNLREIGYSVEMDDFGSGYSSLNTLKDISIDLLKLDMVFLSAVNTRKGAKLVESVVYMAKMLNIPVLTEGVETKEQMDFLTSIGCKYAQGYYFAKPMPIEDYINLLMSSEFDKIK